MVTWPIKDVISPPLKQGLWTPNLVGWWPRMRESHSNSHVVTWQIKDIISPLSRGLWIQNLAGHWLFCGCYDRGFRRGKLDNSSISLFLSFVVKESMLYQMLKKRWDEMNKIVTNSEIHLYHCLCEPRSFKTGRSNHLRCSIKKCSRKFCKIDRKTSIAESGTSFFQSVL